MNCLKCGSKTVDEHVFCDSCLGVMAKYPVKPGTAVNIPRRPRAPELRRINRRKTEPEPEERIAVLRKILRRMSMVIVVLLAALIVCGICIFNLLGQPSPDEPITGRNYSTVTPE